MIDVCIDNTVYKTFDFDELFPDERFAIVWETSHFVAVSFDKTDTGNKLAYVLSLTTNVRFKWASLH